MPAIDLGGGAYRRNKTDPKVIINYCLWGEACPLWGASLSCGSTCNTSSLPCWALSSSRLSSPLPFTDAGVPAPLFSRPWKVLESQETPLHLVVPENSIDGASYTHSGFARGS